METTFEKELLAREFQHKVIVLGAYITREYIREQTSGDIKLPEFMIEQQSSDFTMKQIHRHLTDGTFDKEYQKAWENIKNDLPDNYSACM